MKKLSYSLSALAIVTVAAAAIFLAVPQDVTAGCYDCQCFGPVRQTSTQQADEATCAIATSVLHQNLEQEAGCSSFCVNNLVITMPCTFNPEGSGSWWVSGYLEYQCEICRPTCP